MALAPQQHTTVYLIGDSTMADKEKKAWPETGWGMPFSVFFDQTVTVENHAKNGRSTRTFISENRWEPIVDKLKPGDYVLIQFGHNDESKEKADRYTSPAQYKENLTKFVVETRNKGASPILITPVSRRKFDKDGIALQTHEAYAPLVREVAKTLQVPLIDLDETSRALWAALAPGDQSTVEINDYSDDGATVSATIEDANDRKRVAVFRRDGVAFRETFAFCSEPVGLVTMPTLLSVTAPDGFRSHAYLYAPAAPALVDILYLHGGPKGASSQRYNPMFQYLVDEGHRVLSLDYRGSAGYGDAYIEAGWDAFDNKPFRPQGLLTATYYLPTANAGNHDLKFGAKYYFTEWRFQNHAQINGQFVIPPTTPSTRPIPAPTPSA
ncbi:MAG: hypothetical protein HC859_15235 [Bacteroidia bacterium]|nr:hypothetical protein [Bacteroidia bacterium]